MDNQYANYEPLVNMSFKKSNQMISAKYAATLMENKITAIALTRIEVNAKSAGNKPELFARLYPGELKRLLGSSDHIYSTLKSISKTLPGHTMFLEDGMGNFKSFAIVTNADYINGIFTIRFNSELAEHVLNLEKNYTTLELSVLTGFSKNSSFRLYELLKREVYRSNPKINGGRVDVEYRLTELKFMIGLADADSKNLKTELRQSSGAIDWDKMYERLEKNERKYDTWLNLQRRIIIPAQEELKEKSNIRFEYEGVREGRKVTKILFHIYPNKPSEELDIYTKQKILEDQGYRQMEIPMDSYPDLYKQYIGHNNLEKEDIDKLLEYAGYDEACVKECIALADKQPHLNNYMGWIIHAIRTGMKSPVEVVDGSAEKAEEYKKLRESTKDKSIQEMAWHRITEKDDFFQFLSDTGFDKTTLEVIYDDPQERVRLYTEWKLGNFNTL